MAQINENTLYSYAWNWFEYHAGQRISGFRFFLLFLCALGFGYYIGVKDGYVVFAQVVAGFGAFMSLLFLLLEIRNEQLVNVGRNALLYIENNEEIMQRHPGLHLLSVDRGRNPWLSHKYWFRATYVLTLILFCIATAYPRLIHTDPPNVNPRLSAPANASARPLETPTIELPSEPREPAVEGAVP